MPRHFTTYIVTLITACVGRLSLNIRILIGRFLGGLFSYLPTKDRAVAKAQIKAFLPKHLHPSIRSVYAEVGQTILESFNLEPYLSKYRDHIAFDKRDIMLEWIADSRPLIAFPGHCSNWDLLAACLISKGIPITTTGRTAKAASFQEFLSKFRNNYGVKTIWRSGSGISNEATKELIRDLKRKRVVATMLDQDTNVGSTFTNFFGSPASTPSSLVELGLRKNARFITSFIVRTGWSQYEIIIDEIPDGLSADQILNTYNIRLENIIKKFPAQWVWFHKRWRTLQNGNKLSTREYLQMLLSK